MGKRFAIVIGVAAAGVMALGAQTATADSVGRTEGDARAAFNAVAGGGFAIADNPGTHSGAPIGGIPSGIDGGVHNPEDVRIYFAGDRFSYCASGWHVIMLAWWVTESELVGNTDAFAYLDAVDMSFAWDGVPLVEERTAIKRFNIDEDAFFVAAGTFMPPGSLSVGKHRLVTTGVEGIPLFGDEVTTVNVKILPC